ncbi:MAG: 50S ribosomal protein L4 [Pontimonas sp.]
MSAIDVLDATGKKSGAVDLPADVFDVQTNVPLIHQVVVAQLAAARQGTHKVKHRGEVAGSGRKPFKQKGTGRARQGSIRAPEHRGGGVVHGPTPRSYAQRTPKKMIRQALFGALSDRARAERLHVVQNFGLGDTPSTKTAASLLRATAPGPKVLVVVGRGDEVGQKSVRNLPGVHALHPDQLNAYDVLGSDDIVFTQDAFEQFVSGSATTAPEATK